MPGCFEGTGDASHTVIMMTRTWQRPQRAGETSHLKIARRAKVALERRSVPGERGGHCRPVATGLTAIYGAGHLLGARAAAGARAGLRPEGHLPPLGPGDRSRPSGPLPGPVPSFSEGRAGTQSPAAWGWEATSCSLLRGLSRSSGPGRPPGL